MYLIRNNIWHISTECSAECRTNNQSSTSSQWTDSQDKSCRPKTISSILAKSAAQNAAQNAATTRYDSGQYNSGACGYTPRKPVSTLEDTQPIDRGYKSNQSASSASVLYEPVRPVHEYTPGYGCDNKYTNEQIEKMTQEERRRKEDKRMPNKSSSASVCGKSTKNNTPPRGTQSVCGEPGLTRRTSDLRKPIRSLNSEIDRFSYKVGGLPVKDKEGKKMRSGFGSTGGLVGSGSLAKSSGFNLDQLGRNNKVTREEDDKIKARTDSYAKALYRKGDVLTTEDAINVRVAAGQNNNDGLFDNNMRSLREYNAEKDGAGSNFYSPEQVTRKTGQLDRDLNRKVTDLFNPKRKPDTGINPDSDIFRKIQELTRTTKEDRREFDALRRSEECAKEIEA